MADDGLLVNFSIGDEVLKTRPVFQGGRWKDRLVAKRRSQRVLTPKQSAEKPQPHSTSEKDPSSSTSDRPTTEPPSKRVKLSPSAAVDSKPYSTRPSHEVISSLFSSNPSTNTAAPNPLNEGKTNIEPSNAPLQDDGTSTFTSLGLSSTLSTHLLTKLHLKTPTAIQASTITQLLKEDSDAFIQAETGSGKTLAYLLPIVQKVMELSSTPQSGIITQENGDFHSKMAIHRDSGLFAIVLAPTRELCKQISIVLESLLRCANWIVAGTVIGGEKKKSEKARLRKGVNILVATPGRLVDHLKNTEAMDVGMVRWLVLDEGDRLMELGFEEDIKTIVGRLEKSNCNRRGSTEIPGLPKKRTTIMCSATMKTTVQRLGEISLKDAAHIKAEDQKQAEDASISRSKNSAFLAPAQLQQSYLVVPPKQRLVTLAALLKRTFARRGSVMKAIVFLSCADSVDFHFEVFARKDQLHDKPRTDKPDKDNPATTLTVPVADLPTVTHTVVLASKQNPSLKLHKLHGSLSQSVRTATLSAFVKSAEPSILLCTDVASRGLDLPNIEFIVEYDPPFSADDHLHRIGRTARAGREGRAIIFLTPGPEEEYVGILKQGYRDGLGKALVRHTAEDVMSKGFGTTEYGYAIDQSLTGRNWNERAEEWQLAVERWILDNERIGEMARKAFVSHVRAYATHIAKERRMFDVKSLHLGHLAKAFALREKPGNLGRGGAGANHHFKKSQNVKQSMEEPSDRASETRNVAKSKKAENIFPANGQDTAKRMRTKIKEHMAVASEFNIG
ncbi:MAG: hypothetical protein LQ342_000925 [Letrouitia transgressa]|nr:MAG: hypothetical protein LQ342_000925 [Letrouitia transgressa]